MRGRDTHDETRVRARSNDGIGTHVHRQACLLEDVVELVDELRGELFLAQVVVVLDYHRDEHPTLALPPRRPLPIPCLLLFPPLLKDHWPVDFALVVACRPRPTPATEGALALRLPALRERRDR